MKIILLGYFTYSMKLLSLFILLLDILDQVIAEKTHRKVVIGADSAREDRNAGNAEKQVFTNLFGTGHFY